MLGHSPISNSAPNHALQRTAPAVTLAAPPPSPAQPSRQPPQSLNLGSFSSFPKLSAASLGTSPHFLKLRFLSIHRIATPAPHPAATPAPRKMRAFFLTNGEAASHRPTLSIGKRSFKTKAVPKDAALNFGNENNKVQATSGADSLQRMVKPCICLQSLWRSCRSWDTLTID